MKSVIGMGNALTDILINLKNDEILDTFKLPRGSMNLVDSELQRQVDASVADAPHTLSLGGSASNTIRALARMGASTGYIGKVGRDETGDFFERTLNELQIAPTVFRGDEPSGRCVSLVSPDGERTMCTYLGAALEMRHTELTPEIFDGYEYFYIEGYLVQDHELISNAVRIAKERGLQVALDLASFNIVEENLGFLHDLVDRHVDILFANEQEAAAFTGEKNPLEALDKIAFKLPFANVTPYVVIAFMLLVVVLMCFSASYRIAVIAGVIWLAVLFAAAQLALGKSGSERGEDAAVIVDAAAATAE